MVWGGKTSLAQGTTTWNIDNAHTRIGFSVSHMVISDVKGEFKRYDGKVITRGDDFSTATVEISIDVNSIYTANEKRDEHLKSPDFFDAQKYPKITFRSKKVVKKGNNQYQLVGDLTIKDVTKEVTLEVVHKGTVKDPWGNTRSGFRLTGKINRFDFGLKWNMALEAGGLVVGEDVYIECDVELIKG